MNRLEYPKVVAAIVTSEAKAYCQEEFFAQILAIKYPNFDYVIVDNSKTENNAKLLRSYGLKNVIWNNNPNKLDLRHLMAECNEITRTEAINMKVRFFLNIESDIFFNKSVIPFMVFQNLEVLTCPYLWGQYEAKEHLLRQSYEDEVNEETKTITLKEKKLTFEESFLFLNGEIKPILFSAIGFIMLRGDVLNKIAFRIGETNLVANADSSLGEDLVNLGIQTHTYACPKAIFMHWQTPISWKSISKIN